MVEIGDPAPDFRLPNRRGDFVSLHDLQGKQNVVVYFYPKDFTRGCTAEACSFRDSYEAFKELGAEVIGISSDDQNSHDAFARQHKLPFILLSDTDGSVRKAYGVKKSMGLFEGRVSFVVDKKGIVRHIFSSQFRATAHIGKALEIIRKLQ